MSNVFAGVVSAPFNIANSSYASKLFSVTPQITYPTATGVRFSPDGTKMFVLSTTGYIYAYSLSTAWDVSSASYVATSPAVLSASNGLWISDDGIYAYIASYSYGSMNRYAMSTPFDVTTITSSGTISTSPPAQDVWFNPTGTKMYFMNATASTIVQYSTASPFVLPGATSDGISLNTTAQFTGGNVGAFSADGKNFIVTSYSTLYQYILTAAWDLSTASYSGHSYAIPTGGAPCLGAFISPDGTKAYFSLRGTGSTNAIHQYNLSP